MEHNFSKLKSIGGAGWCEDHCLWASPSLRRQTAQRFGTE